MSYVVALGMFDGVHPGHRALLVNAAQTARERGCKSVAFTFSNHPLELFGGDFEYLTNNAEREARILACGIDEVVMLPFTRELANTSPENFVKLLHERFECALNCVVVGYNYSFGRGGKGDAELLTKLGQVWGFEVVTIGAVSFEGEPLSSSRIRRAVKAGDMELARKLLTKPYSVEGVVVRNRGIGHKLGFPTANIDTGKFVLPKDGVYACSVWVNGELCPAVTNIGTNPTIGGSKRSTEAHIIGKDLDLYGSVLKAQFHQRLRGDVRFESLEALKTQIARDVETAKKIFENGKKVFTTD